MSPAITLRNIVGVAEDILGEAFIPLHRHFDGNAILALHLEMEHRIQGRLVGVDMVNKRLEATFVMEQLFLAAALINQTDGDTGIQEGQLAQALGQHLVVEFDIGKGQRRRLEAYQGTSLLGLAHDAQRRLRLAMAIDLLVDIALTPDGQLELFG